LFYICLSIWINFRENRRSYQEWTIRRNWQHWVQKTQYEDKQNTKHNTICVGHHYPSSPLIYTVILSSSRLTYVVTLSSSRLTYVVTLSSRRLDYAVILSRNILIYTITSSSRPLIFTVILSSHSLIYTVILSSSRLTYVVTLLSSPLVQTVSLVHLLYGLTPLKWSMMIVNKSITTLSVTFVITVFDQIKSEMQTLLYMYVYYQQIIFTNVKGIRPPI